MEPSILVRVSLCLDPNSSHAIGIPEKALRAIDGNAGAGEKDSEYRRALRKKVLDETIPPELISTTAIIPGFGPLAAAVRSERIALGLEKKMVDAFGEKLVRGANYVGLQPENSAEMR